MSNTLQLYSLATPNGQKVSVALEEMGLSYDAHKIDITKGEQFSEDFVKINPNSKIPALVDPVGDNGKPLVIMESGAILVYLAEKSKKFLPADPAKRSEVLQWLFFQVGGVGPMFGQFGHFHKYAKEKCDHPYPKERYATEAKRLLNVMEKQLGKNEFLAGSEISIADFATVPWVIGLDAFYKATEVLELGKFKNVNRWVNTFKDRPAFQKGMEVCPLV
jgi:GST-like protein